MRCSCGYQFALDPKIDLINDYKMKVLVDKVSSFDTKYFTYGHLYFLFRKSFFKSGSYLIPAFIVGVIVCGLYIMFEGFGLEAIFVCGVAIISLFVLNQIQKTNALGFEHSFGLEKFSGLVDLWRRDKPIKLIAKPELSNPPPDWQEQDIYDYGVNAIVIVDEDVLVDFMIRNEFHTSNHCLIISTNGYPDYLMSVASELIRKTPELPVYFFHQYDPANSKPSSVLETDQWQFLNGQYIDMGLNKKNIQDLKVLKDLQFGEAEIVPLSALPIAFFENGMSLILSGELVSLTDVAIAGVSAVALGHSDFG